MSPEQIDTAEFELFIDDEYAATASGPRAFAWAEIQHYVVVYRQDGEKGVFTVFEVTRTPVTSASSSRSEEVEELLEKVEATKLDAERYRYLRDAAHPDMPAHGIACFWTDFNSWGKPYNSHYSGARLDEAIDAARSALKEN